MLSTPSGLGLIRNIIGKKKRFSTINLLNENKIGAEYEYNTDAWLMAVQKGDNFRNINSVKTCRKM
jgi:hypothetical protein